MSRTYLRIFAYGERHAQNDSSRDRRGLYDTTKSVKAVNAAHFVQPEVE